MSDIKHVEQLNPEAQAIIYKVIAKAIRREKKRQEAEKETRKVVGG